MNPDPLKALVDLLESRLLSDFGFKRRGNSFYVEKEEGFAVINFQRSTSTPASSGQAKFTVNLGVALRALLDPRTASGHTPPPVEECHWQTRLADYLTPPQDDKWWTLNRHVESGSVVNEVQEALFKRAINEMLQLTSKTALRKLWLSGIYAGLTDRQRSSYLDQLGPA